MSQVKLSSKFQIIIPREAREALNLKAGDELMVVAHDGQMIVFEKPKAYHTAIHGIARGVYPDNYLAKEHESWD